MKCRRRACELTPNRNGCCCAAPDQCIYFVKNVPLALTPSVRPSVRSQGEKADNKFRPGDIVACNLIVVGLAERQRKKRDFGK